MPILYKNIRNGKEVNLSANAYQEHLAQSSVFEKQFFYEYKDSVSLLKRQNFVNGTILYKFRYKTIDKDIYILWGPLKNSGTSGVQRKRIQVLPAVPLHEEVPYFAVGGYDTLDTVLYTSVLTGVREFIKHAQSGKSYSSLWIDYPSIWDTYKFGVQTWNDKVGRDILGCTAANICKLHDTIKKYVALSTRKGAQEPQLDDDIDDPMKLVDFSNEIDKYTEEMDLPRNPSFREIAFRRENYTCELCGTHQTFTDKNNEEYFEGHHLIMYNTIVQRRFRYCLDNPTNIICLCPTCHRKIHHSSEQDTMKLLVKLFTKHNDLLKSYGIKNLNDIINDYKTF